MHKSQGLQWCESLTPEQHVNPWLAVHGAQGAVEASPWGTVGAAERKQCQPLFSSSPGSTPEHATYCSQRPVRGPRGFFLPLHRPPPSDLHPLCFGHPRSAEKWPRQNRGQDFTVLAHTVGDAGKQEAQRELSLPKLKKIIWRDNVKTILDNLKWNTKKCFFK